MTRIGTFQQSHAILADVMRNQSRAFEAQQQVASGHKGEHFKDIARDVPMLFGAKTVLARVESQVETNRTLQFRLDGYDVDLRSLEVVGGDLRQAVLDAIGSNSGLSFIARVQGLFDQAVGLLNTRIGDSYIFGGTKSDQAPVTTTTVAGLVALAEPPTAAFANNQIAPSARISDSQTLEYGFLADGVGQDLLQAMQRILQFEAGILPVGAGAYAPAGPFGDELTENQRDFLNGELVRLGSVTTDLTVVVAKNGIRMAMLESVQIRHEERMTYTKRFITEVEDVDMAAAIVGLNLDQLALESSLGVMARIGRLSLLDFL